MPIVIYAQEETPEPIIEDCPSIVQTAIDLTLENCDATGLNEVCYGYLVLDAQPREGISEFDFTLPGDTVNAVDVQSLRLSGMDTTTGQWGVVMMEIEADLVDDTSDVSDQDVQIILFGDVELEDATRFLQVTATETINIRTIPSTDGDIISSLAQGETIVVNGQSEDGTWLRVRLSDESNNLGWVSTTFITVDGDLSALEVIPDELTNSEFADDLAVYGPMQAFYFQSGINDAPCAEAPNSGILIQTPEGVASVSIWMDEVVIQMDDTAFLQAEAGGNLTVNVISGTAQVEALGETSIALEGMAIEVPLDDDLGAIDVPSDPQAIDLDTIQSIPIDLLDNEVTIPEPAIIQAGVPIEGQWAFNWGVELLSCPDGTEVPFTSTGGASPIIVQAEGIAWNTTTYTQTATGVYIATYADGNSNLHQDTLQVISPDFIQGEKVLDLVSPICTLNVPFTLTLVGG